MTLNISKTYYDEILWEAALPVRIEKTTDAVISVLFHFLYFVIFFKI